MLVLLKFISLTGKAIQMLRLVLFVPKLNFSDANPAYTSFNLFKSNNFICGQLTTLFVDKQTNINYTWKDTLFDKYFI